MYHVSTTAPRGKKRTLMPWKWSYWLLWATWPGCCKPNLSLLQKLLFSALEPSLQSPNHDFYLTLLMYIAHITKKSSVFWLTRMVQLLALKHFYISHAHRQQHLPLCNHQFILFRICILPLDKAIHIKSATPVAESFLFTQEWLCFRHNLAGLVVSSFHLQSTIPL